MFLKSLWSKVQSARDRGVKPNMNEYRPLQRGEEVIGTITDPDLLALVALVDDAEAEFLLRWPEPPTNAVAMQLAMVAGEERIILHDLARYEIRKAFSMGPNDPVVLRQGYGGPVLVKPAPDDVPPNGLTVAAIVAARAAREIERASDSLDDGVAGLLAAITQILPDCGNPTCRIHGRQAKLDRMNLAALDALGLR
jgi:hypothetical protein